MFQIKLKRYFGDDGLFGFCENDQTFVQFVKLNVEHVDADELLVGISDDQPHFRLVARRQHERFTRVHLQTCILKALSEK